MNDEANNPTEESSGAMDDRSLETVRDILFGAQARELDKRTQQLEKLINTSVERLEKSFNAKIDSIEKSIERMRDQLKKEAENTAQKIDTRFKEAHETISSLDARTRTDLSDHADQAAADLAGLEKQASSWNEDLAKQLELVEQQLKDAKADRSMLSELFTSMAVAISDDSRQ